MNAPIYLDGIVKNNEIKDTDELISNSLYADYNEDNSLHGIEILKIEPIVERLKNSIEFSKEQKDFLTSVIEHWEDTQPFETKSLYKDLVEVLKDELTK